MESREAAFGTNSPGARKNRETDIPAFLGLKSWGEIQFERKMCHPPFFAEVRHSKCASVPRNV